MKREELVTLPQGTSIFYFEDSLQSVVEQKFEKISKVDSKDRVHFLRGGPTNTYSLIEVDSFDEVSRTAVEAWQHVERKIIKELRQAQSTVTKLTNRVSLIREAIDSL